MRVLWREAMLALLALLSATVTGEHSAASVDTVILHIAADSTVNQTIVDQITLEASRFAAVWTMRPPAGRDCHDKDQLTEKKATGLIHITDSDGTCMQTVGNPRRLQIIYNKGTKETRLWSNTGDLFTVGDPKFKQAVDNLVQLVAADARKHAFKETKQSTSSVSVPIWSVIILGVLVGVLLAANCIFFNKLRVIQTRPNPAEDKKAKDKARESSRTSLKQRKAAERKKSASSSSKSSKKSSKDRKKSKKEDDSSCRSSKSLSTKSCKNSAPTSVKVVSVGAPAAKKLEHARPLDAATDEVATVMALRGSSLPARTMDRVRGSVPPPPKTATVPPAGWSATVPQPPTITTQPRPLGPSIVPKVSVIGHSPFAVLATATSPLPPASTPAIVSSAPTAYSSPSAVVPPPTTTVAPSAPPPPAPTAVVVVVQKSPPSISPSPPTVVNSPKPPAAPSPATVSANGPSQAAVAPIPLTLVRTGTPSSDPPPESQVTVATTPTTPVQVKRVPISPAYSLASTPASASPSSSREKAPTSKRSGKK